MNRSAMINSLEKHHSAQMYRPEQEFSNVVNVDGSYLGPYIPYVGSTYCEAKPRILIYAMAQNLARAEGLIRKFLRSPDKGMLRQQSNSNPPYIHLHPYDDGHLPILAALVLNAYPNTIFKPTSNIHSLVCATNFVKFSFWCEGQNGTRRDVNPPRDIYKAMWDYFCSYEIEILRPEVIITVSQDVSNALKKHYSHANSNTLVINLSFPGRLNLNRRFIPEGKKAIANGYNPEPFRTRMSSLLKGTPNPKGYLHKVIATDWYYFLKMKDCIKKQLQSL